MSMDYHPGPCCDPRVGISLWVRDVFVIAHVASKAPHQSGSPTTFIQGPAQAIVQQFLATFKDSPARAKAASFTVDQIVESLMPPAP